MATEPSAHVSSYTGLHGQRLGQNSAYWCHLYSSKKTKEHERRKSNSGGTPPRWKHWTPRDGRHLQARAWSQGSEQSQVPPELQAGRGAIHSTGGQAHREEPSTAHISPSCVVGSQAGVQNSQPPWGRRAYTCSVVRRDTGSSLRGPGSGRLAVGQGSRSQVQDLLSRRAVGSQPARPQAPRPLHSVGKVTARRGRDVPGAQVGT